MSFPQKVKSALWAIVDTMACNTAQFVKNPGKDFTRDRKMGFVQLIRFFLCMGSGCISHELLKYFYFLPDEVPHESSHRKKTGKWEHQVNLSMSIKICFAFLSDHMDPGNVNDLISRYIASGSIPFFETDMQSVCLLYPKTFHCTKYPLMELLTASKIPISPQYMTDLWLGFSDRSCLT